MPKHIEELAEMLNSLGRIGDDMLDDGNFDQFNQIGIAYHAIAAIVGYPTEESEE